MKNTITLSSIDKRHHQKINLETALCSTCSILGNIILIVLTRGKILTSEYRPLCHENQSVPFIVDNFKIVIDAFVAKIILMLKIINIRIRKSKLPCVWRKRPKCLIDEKNWNIAGATW